MMGEGKLKAAATIIGGHREKHTLPSNTLPLKSLLSLASVWSKTTLNTGGVGGTGADLQT